MIKEPKDIDFSTSGRQLTKEDFALISQWIAADKKKQVVGQAKNPRRRQKDLAQSGDNGQD
ncbi:hypothetical protein [Spirosoma validum]|uniref:Uncharacterized protein n=1 Tax=Spirosoma validum TaxID=2771355 RepID=A0A927B7B7_9BACT|nr:hypothetical protein [Spirosoma validum]MBD2756704.1 hypothetical protein [Spirosoma validum]